MSELSKIYQCDRCGRKSKRGEYYPAYWVSINIEGDFSKDFCKSCTASFYHWLTAKEKELEARSV